MGIRKICRLYNIFYQVGLTEPELPSDSEVINMVAYNHIRLLSVIQTLYKESMVKLLLLVGL